MTAQHAAGHPVEIPDTELTRSALWETANLELGLDWRIDENTYPFREIFGTVWTTGDLPIVGTRLEGAYSLFDAAAEPVGFALDPAHHWVTYMVVSDPRKHRGLWKADALPSMTCSTGSWSLEPLSGGELWDTAREAMSVCARCQINDHRHYRLVPPAGLSAAPFVKSYHSHGFDYGYAPDFTAAGSASLAAL